jgi:hypothetical protein
MNAQKKVQATSASNLYARRIVAEIMHFNNLSKSTVKHVKHCYDAFIAGGGPLDYFETDRKERRRRGNTQDNAVVADLQHIWQINEVNGKRAGTL